MNWKQFFIQKKPKSQKEEDMNVINVDVWANLVLADDFRMPLDSFAALEISSLLNRLSTAETTVWSCLLNLGFVGAFD